MEAFIRLLALPESPTAAVLRRSLQGLQYTLGDVLQQAPGDPGAAACRSLLAELAGVLQETGRPTTGAHGRGPETARNRRSEGVRKLSRLREEIEASAQLQERLGPFRLRGNSDAELWGEVQRLFLRLSLAEARTWTQRTAELAHGAGASVTQAVPLRLSDEREEEVYSGLVGSAEAAGLKLTRTAPLHPLLGNGPWSEDAAGIAPHVSFCLQYMDLDASLHHALETVRPPGVHSLASAMHREGYTRELLSRFHQLSKAPDNPVDVLQAWIGLDEAIQSLIHLPLAKPMSWWQQHQQRARQRLDLAAERARQAGHRVRVRWLTGPYRQVKSCSANDWGIESGGNLGEVVVCLRVYAEIDGQVYPGRVIYRDY